MKLKANKTTTTTKLNSIKGFVCLFVFKTKIKGGGEERPGVPAMPCPCPLRNKHEPNRE